MDLIVRNGRLRRREENVDIAVADGKIVEITPEIEAKGQKEIDAKGRLVAPTFVDPHLHLDKALISEVVRENRSGTLSEAIEIIWEKKRNYTIDDIVERACRVIRWAIGNGTTVLRTHVDVDTIGGLVPLKALLEVRDRFKGLVQLQIVAFPQEGIIQDPGTEELMRQAMEAGADVVGGMPYNEMTYDDSKKHIDIAFALARQFDADIDMHVDETDDSGAHTLQYLAAKTIKEKYQQRVTAGHTCALSAYNPYYAAKIINMVRKAEINMITNPATNLMLEGRLDTGPIRRGITRVKELMDAGVNVAYGQDCLKDTFYPTFGRADMLEVGLITAHAAQLSMPGDIEQLFDMPTINSARILRIKNYDIKKGNPATFNIFDCNTVQEVFRLQPGRMVIVNGEVIAERKIENHYYGPKL